MPGDYFGWFWVGFGPVWAGGGPVWAGFRLVLGRFWLVLARNRKFVDLGTKSATKPDEAKPNMPGAMPTNPHKPIPIHFGTVR